MEGTAQNEQNEQNEQNGQNGRDGATSDTLGDTGKRALEAERRARRAAEARAKELETRIKEAEDAEKTEVERLTGQVGELTRRAETAEVKAARYEVAAAKGLTPAQARRLVGATQEELEADADAMRDELGLNDEGTKDGKETPADDGLGRPRENLRGGASNTEDEAVDAAKLADSILAHPF